MMNNLDLRQQPWWQRLTLPRLVTAVLFLGIFAMAARLPFDTDSWWHLQSGRWIIENRAIPRTDPFSHTRFGQPWIDHGWLAQIGWYQVFDWFGYAGPVILLAVLVTTAFYFAWLQCRESNRWLQAFIIIIAAVASGIIWAARPQMVSFLLTSVVAYLLYHFKHGRRRIIWWLPFVILLWVNIHGGFAIGFILIVAYLFGELGNVILKTGSPAIGWRGLRTVALVMLVSIAIIPLNPNGLQMLTYPFRTVGIEILQEFIVEWQAPDFHAFYLHPFIWLLLAALTAFGLAGKRADFTDLTLVALFAYMSFLAVRNIPLFALVTAPVIVRYSSAAWDRWRGTADSIPDSALNLRLTTIVNWLILLIIVGLVFVRIAQSSAVAINERDQADYLPAGALAYLQETNLPGPIFNNYNWGGYIIWHLPQYPVFVDGRTDLSDDDFLRQYLSIYLGDDGWDEKLDSFSINLIVIEPDSGLARKLASQPGWEQAYADQVATIYIRQD
jgi:hypothetical protein